MKNTILKQVREKLGKTQKQIAQESNISEVSYQRIEYNLQRPSLTTAILIADALHVKTYKEFKSIFGAATPEIAKEPGGNQAE